MASDANLTMRDVIGLIPAGGQATRLAPLPCSKELYPIGFRRTDSGTSLRPKVVSHYLLEKMTFAGVSKAYIVLRPGKWDIPAYFGDGTLLNMHLAYLMLGVPFGVPFTLDQAYPFVRHATVAFGFPDILFESDDGFVKLLGRQLTSRADVTLGLFPANHPSTDDTVDFSANGEVRDLIPRPSESRLRYSWAIAVWNPNFTEFLHAYLQGRQSTAAETSELSVGETFRAGLRAGMRVQGLILSEQPYLDVGTPENLCKAIKYMV